MNYYCNAKDYLYKLAYKFGFVEKETDLVIPCFLNDRNVVACWQIISQDPHLMTAIIDHVLDLLSRGLPYEEKSGPREKDPPIRTATSMALTVSCVVSPLS